MRCLLNSEAQLLALCASPIVGRIMTLEEGSLALDLIERGYLYISHSNYTEQIYPNQIGWSRYGITQLGKEALRVYKTVKDYI